MLFVCYIEDVSIGISEQATNMFGFLATTNADTSTPKCLCQFHSIDRQFSSSGRQS